MPMSSPWWLIANTLRGITEYKGTAAEPRILEMFRLSGHGQVRSDEEAWCAAFVGACLVLSGYASSRSLMARSYLKLGTKLDEPCEGCIVVLSRNGANSSYGHVGFFLREDDDQLLLLGGNQGDSVKVSSYPKSRLLGYRWPTERAPVATSGLLPNILQLGVPDDQVTTEALEDEQRGVLGAIDGGQALLEFLPLRPGANPDSVDQIEAIQGLLKEQGYPVGKEDGDYGLRTMTAVFSFQQANGIPPTGIVDARTWFQLRKGEPMPLWPERRNETARDLKREGSETIALTDRGRWLALATALFGVLGLTDARTGLFEKTGQLATKAEAASTQVVQSPSVTDWVMPAAVADEAGSSLPTLLPVLLGSKGGVWIILIVLAVMLWRNAQATTAQRVDEHRTGANLRF
ncbi:TIGR02594 family protein [Bosea sp. F3-2]|uniref:TIGR02594 family protein n=1 Tax=Bosea sp. F3-2 TaxID=2599640 RepID=UPI0020BEB5DC|nr:TIGR02594 family protein [Bosea sp. F3-2]